MISSCYLSQFQSGITEFILALPYSLFVIPFAKVKILGLIHSILTYLLNPRVYINYFQNC